MEYRIRLERMEFHALHGCYELERRSATVSRSISTITAELGDVAAEDCVEKAVNYLTVYEVVREQMRSSRSAPSRSWAPPLGGKARPRERHALER